MSETGIKLLESKLPRLLERHADAIIDASDYRGDLTIVVRREKLVDVVKFLKNDTAMPFNMMMDLFGMDYARAKESTPERFAVVYILYSMSTKRRVRLKVYVPEAQPEVESLHEVYKAANWFEREAWDMFGIRFLGHPHLIRILCHHEFVGHPLRKDYPAERYQRAKTSLPTSEL